MYVGVHGNVFVVLKGGLLACDHGRDLGYNKDDLILSSMQFPNCSKEVI